MPMLHDITGAVPRYKKKTRKGRGKAAGKGKTAGRGTKGSGAHGGDTAWTPGREGGQTPLFKRFPKRGFSNKPFERKFNVVNLSELNDFADGATVDAAMLVEAGLVPDLKQPLKVLGDGELSKKLTVVAAAFSKSAMEKITALGGVAQDSKSAEAYVLPKQKKHVDPAKAWERKQSEKPGAKRAVAAATPEGGEAKADGAK